jgi:hypothetical protein
MKKQLLLLALFISLGLSKANCQTPDWVWARSAQSNVTGAGIGWSIATDKSCNEYITGYYKDTITFVPFILTSTSNSTSYLAKYDSSGNVRWTKSAVNSSMGNSYRINVCTDIFGNAYVIGYFTDTVSFGSYTLVSAGSTDIFLVKYDSFGNILWARSAGGINAEEGLWVTTDLSGNVYITGFFQSPTVTFDSYTLTNVGNTNIFIVKYDSSGNVLWAKSEGGSADDYGYSIATDAFANVFITGRFSSSHLILGSYALNNAGNWDIFLAKYDSSGNVLWAKSAGGADTDEGVCTAADAAGNVYITGWYLSTSISFGSYTLVNPGQYNAYLVKYDSLGNVRWAKNIGGPGTEMGYCVAVDSANRVYITGAFSSPALTFDTITVHVPFIYDPMYIAGYDSTGHVLFAKALVSGGANNNAVAASPLGSIYIGGDFELVNPFIIGNDSLVHSGYTTSENVFVAKLSYSQSGQGISEISPAKEFLLYPNPFDDKLTASPPAPLQGRAEEEELTLFDVFSRVLLRRSFVNSATINTEQLARGIYFYEIKDKDGVAARGK